MVYGYAVGLSQDTELALKSWKEAKETVSRLWGDIDGIIVHQDQDSVFTGYEYVSQMVINDKVALSYAQKGNPGENAAKESFIGHFKVENRSLFLEAESLDELKRIVEDRIHYYNEKRRHQTLGYLTPKEYLENWQHGLQKRGKNRPVLVQ